jgi:hypothetical protein
MIIHPDAFNRMQPAGFDGVFHWDFLLPAFAGTTITPMDIDALVERNGMFLAFETKSPGCEIPRGQALALERLVWACRGRMKVITINAKHPDEIAAWQVWTLDENGNPPIRKRKQEGTAEKLTAGVKRWFQQVNLQPSPIWRLPPATHGPADLFRELISDPVEAATVHLQSLSDADRERVLERFGWW